MVLEKTLLRLQTRITLLVCVIVLLALGVTGTTVALRVGAQVRESLAEKAIIVSRLVAESGPVVEALQSGQRLEEVRSLAESVRRAAAVDFVVVLDMNGKRLSHPNAAIIGNRFQGGDDAAVYRGAAYTSVAQGTLGESLRAFTPVRDRSGRQVGAGSTTRWSTSSGG